jgi:hypothetical protein
MVSCARRDSPRVTRMDCDSQCVSSQVTHSAQLRRSAFKDHDGDYARWEYAMHDGTMLCTMGHFGTLLASGDSVSACAVVVVDACCCVSASSSAPALRP